jgi:hypothetical protein
MLGKISFARLFGLGVCFLSSFSASIKTGFAKDFGRTQAITVCLMFIC